jgi:FTR1 family protein
MVETAIITLREGLEAALIVTIILTVLRQRGRADLQPWVLAGLSVATALAVGGVFWIPELLSRWRVHEEAYEGALYLVGSLLVGSFLIWLYRHRGWASGVREATQRQLARRWAGPAMLALTFLMVFREALETLVFVAAISFSTAWLLQVFGFLIGLALTVVFGWAFYRGSRWVPLSQIFRLSLVVLTILTVQFFVTGVHEWVEAEILPGGPTEMAVIGPIVNNQMIIFTVLLAVVALFMVVGRVRLESLAALDDVPPGQDPAVVRRRQQYQWRQYRRWRWVFIGTTAVAAFSLTGFYLYTKAPPMEPAHPLAVQGEWVVIPVEPIPVRQIAFWGVPVGDTQIRLLTVRLDERTVRVALDACVLCGPKGYYQRGSQVYCRNCAAPLVFETIGLPGGCNPIPVPFEVRGAEVWVRVKDIQAAIPARWQEGMK